MDIWDWSQEVKGKEELFLEKARRQLRDVNLRLKKALHKASTIDELNAVKADCLSKRNDLKLLMEIKGDQLGLRHLNHHPRIEAINKRFLSRMDEILEEVEARIQITAPSKPVQINKHDHLKKLSDLFDPEKAGAYIGILKKEFWPGGLERLADDKGNWKGIKEAGLIFLNELKDAGVISVPMSKAVKLLEAQFSGFRDPKKKIEADDRGHKSNDYRKHFKIEIDRIKRA